MKVLIAYYSFTGKTAELAKVLHAYLKDGGHSVSVEEINPKKAYSSITAYTVGCYDAARKATPPIKPLKYNPTDFDCIVVLSPTWAWTYVPPVATYLSLLPTAKNGQLAISGSTGGSLVAYKHITQALKKKGYGIVGELAIKSYPALPSSEELKKIFASSLRLPGRSKKQ